MDKIELSSSPGRFTGEELRAKVRESKAFWESPEGIVEKRKLAARSNRKLGVKFPDLATRKGTRPEIAGTQSVKNAIRRLNLIS